MEAHHPLLPYHTVQGWRHPIKTSSLLLYIERHTADISEYWCAVFCLPSLTPLFSLKFPYPLNKHPSFSQGVSKPSNCVFSLLAFDAIFILNPICFSSMQLLYSGEEGWVASSDFSPRVLSSWPPVIYTMFFYRDKRSRRYVKSSLDRSLKGSSGDNSKPHPPHFGGTASLEQKWTTTATPKKGNGVLGFWRHKEISGFEKPEYRKGPTFV